MTAPSGRVVRNVHHGTRLTTEDLDGADAAGPGELRDVARQLVRSMRRGVVTYSPDDEPPDDLSGANLP